MYSVSILVGTMTGTAEMVAEDIEAVLSEQEIDVNIRLMDNLTPDVFDDKDTAFLICSSTYGQGDVPDNAQQFFEALTTGNPDLSGILYGLIALGDRTYSQTFCDGGFAFDTLLTKLGAVRVGEPFSHDASSNVFAEDAAAEWVVEWVKLLPDVKKKVAA